jgi:hypothetical protein
MQTFGVAAIRACDLGCEPVFLVIANPRGGAGVPVRGCAPLHTDLPKIQVVERLFLRGARRKNE